MHTLFLPSTQCVPPLIHIDVHIPDETVAASHYSHSDTPLGSVRRQNTPLTVTSCQSSVSGKEAEARQGVDTSVMGQWESKANCLQAVWTSSCKPACDSNVTEKISRLCAKHSALALKPISSDWNFAKVMAIPWICLVHFEWHQTVNCEPHCFSVDRIIMKEQAKKQRNKNKSETKKGIGTI
jgi:hypothetical protein